MWYLRWKVRVWVKVRIKVRVRVRRRYGIRGGRLGLELVRIKVRVWGRVRISSLLGRVIRTLFLAYCQYHQSHERKKKNNAHVRRVIFFSVCCNNPDQKNRNRNYRNGSSFLPTRTIFVLAPTKNNKHAFRLVILLEKKKKRRKSRRTNVRIKERATKVISLHIF